MVSGHSCNRIFAARSNKSVAWSGMVIWCLSLFDRCRGGAGKPEHGEGRRFLDGLYPAWPGSKFSHNWYWIRRHADACNYHLDGATLGLASVLLPIKRYRDLSRAHVVVLRSRPS